VDYPSTTARPNDAQALATAEEQFQETNRRRPLYGAVSDPPGDAPLPNSGVRSNRGETLFSFSAALSGGLIGLNVMFLRFACRPGSGTFGAFRPCACCRVKDFRSKIASEARGRRLLRTCLRAGQTPPIERPTDIFDRPSAATVDGVTASIMAPTMTNWLHEIDAACRPKSPGVLYRAGYPGRRRISIWLKDCLGDE